MPAIIADLAQLPSPFGRPEDGLRLAGVLSSQQQNQTTVANKDGEVNAILLVIVRQTEHVLLGVLVVLVVGRQRVLHPERDGQVLAEHRLLRRRVLGVLGALEEKDRIRIVTLILQQLVARPVDLTVRQKIDSFAVCIC